MLMDRLSLLLILCLLWRTDSLHTCQNSFQSQRLKYATSLCAIKNPLKNFKPESNPVVSALIRNPISDAVYTIYSFFYNYPRKNMPYDIPWTLFKNNTAEFLAYHQLPHNLPPYRYLGEGLPEDFFCFGLAGNSLPLGNWDPFAFAQVQSTVVRKYRESELKHGRIAMLASLGYLLQEYWHPLYPEIGGLAMTHMSQLRTLPLTHTYLYSFFQQFFSSDTTSNLLQDMVAGREEVFLSWDYLFLMFLFGSVESYYLIRNWTRWRSDEYTSQFNQHIGIGNLKNQYQLGDYGWDILRLYPRGDSLEEKEDRRWIETVELNHGRLAMIAFIGMLGQEYLTGIPVITTATHLSEWMEVWLSSSSSTLSIDTAAITTSGTPSTMSSSDLITNGNWFGNTWSTIQQLMKKASNNLQ
jgi:hypothetical protein